MILSDPETEAQYMEQGIWGHATLDMLLARAARQRPDHEALVISRGSLTRSLTFAEIESRVASLAHILREQGIQPEARIVIYGDDPLSLITSMLAVQRSDAIAVPVSCMHKASALAELLEPLSPSGLIAAHARDDENADYTPVYELASQLFTFRLVAGFGPHCPDGIVDLEALMEESSEHGLDAAPQTRLENGANHVALAHAVSGHGRTLALVARSHNNLICAGLAHVLEGNFTPDMRLLTPFTMNGAVGLQSALVPWLLTSGTLLTPTLPSIADIAHEIQASAVSHAAIPTRLRRDLAHHLNTVDAQLAGTMIVHRSDDIAVAADSNEDQRCLGTVVHVQDIASLAALPLAHIGDGDVASMPVPEWSLGSLHYPSNRGQQGPALHVSRIKGRASGLQGSTLVGGELVLAGPSLNDHNMAGQKRMIAQPLRDESGFVQTKLGVKLVSKSPARFVMLGRKDDLVSVGSLAVDLEVLDTAISALDCISEAACYAIDHPLLGKAIGIAVVPAEGWPHDAQAFAKQIMQAQLPYHVPFVCLDVVSEIPRTNSGTVKRGQLVAAEVAA